MNTLDSSEFKNKYVTVDRPGSRRSFKIPLRNLVGTLVLIAGVIVSVALVQRLTNLRPSAVDQTTDLYFLPSSQTMSSMTPVEVELIIDSKTDRVGFVRAELTFDNTQVELATGIIPSSTLNNLISVTGVDEANLTGSIVIVQGIDQANLIAPPTGV